MHRPVRGGGHEQVLVPAPEPDGSDGCAVLGVVRLREQALVRGEADELLEKFHAMLAPSAIRGAERDKLRKRPDAFAPREVERTVVAHDGTTRRVSAPQLAEMAKKARGAYRRAEHIVHQDWVVRHACNVDGQYGAVTPRLSRNTGKLAGATKAFHRAVALKRTAAATLRERAAQEAAKAAEAERLRREAAAAEEEQRKRAVVEEEWSDSESEDETDSDEDRLDPVAQLRLRLAGAAAGPVRRGL